MVLEEYKAKRNFRKTPEPGAAKDKPHKKPIFVIQEHHASRLHYDFRLEDEGVLKSWAVPKQPSLDPADKRLAVRVEDHPLAYSSFKGRIPEGQYGAGTVAIWDHGTYENLLGERPVPQTVTEGIESGRVEFRLHGKRLKGDFALIRMRRSGRGKENWLLIKKRDEHAKRSASTTRARLPRERGETSSPRSRGRLAVKKSSSAAPQLVRPAGKPEAVTFTHTDRVHFPDERITKGDVLEYYGAISARLLPYLRDRPATLERLPEGIGGSDLPHFWQKNTPKYYPSWIPRVSLPTEKGRDVDYVLVNDRQTLLYLVNQGTLTFHVGFSRLADLDRPDFVLFDLDRNRAPFADVITVARHLRDRLKKNRTPAFVKTSGKTGLHVMVPWKQPGDFDAARSWASAVAAEAVAELPDLATTEIRKAGRGKRVYIDVMQNVKGHHAVPAYVVRAVPGAPVSTPLDWDELTPDLDPEKFNLRTILRRLSRQKHDPMAGLLSRQ